MRMMFKSASYSLNRKFWLAACVAAGQRIRWHNDTPQRADITHQKRLWIDLQGVAGELLALRHANQFGGEYQIHHGITRFAGPAPFDLRVGEVPIEVKCVFMEPHKRLLLIDERSVENMKSNKIRKLVAVLTSPGSCSAVVSRVIDIDQIVDFERRDMNGRRPYCISLESLCNLYMYKPFPKIALECSKCVMTDMELIHAIEGQIDGSTIADTVEEQQSARKVVDRLAEFSTVSV